MRPWHGISRSLASRVSEVSTTFRKKQTAYLKKLRSLGGMSASLDSRAGTPNVTANPYTDPAMQDSELDRSSAQSTLLQTAQVRRRTGCTTLQSSNANAKLRRLRKVSSTSQTSSKIYSRWLSTKGHYSIGSITMWNALLSTSRLQTRSWLLPLATKRDRRRGRLCCYSSCWWSEWSSWCSSSPKRAKQNQSHA